MSSTHADNKFNTGGNGVSAHVCDICGVNQSSRGKVFANGADVWQHKLKRHPEAIGERPVNGESAPAATARPARKKSAKSVLTARPAAHVQFCPSCGCNLQAVHAALEFVHESSLISN